MIRVLIIILIILAIIFLVGGGYFLGLQGSASKDNSPVLQNTNAPVASSTPQQPEPVTPVPVVSSTPASSAIATPKPIDTITAIEDAFVSEKFENLKPNLADKVMLIAYATSCCGETSDYKKVAEFISGYVQRGKNWTFNPKDAKYDGLKKSSDLYVIAEDGRALAFKLDDAKKLKNITFYSDYRLSQ